MFRKKSSTRQRHPSITPKKSQSVFSYYNQRSINQVPLGRQVKQVVDKHSDGTRPWWHYAPSVIALLAIVGSLVYILSLSANPKVLQAGGSGLLRPTTVYQQAAQKQFASSWLNHSKLTVNTAAITSQLEVQFPELADISITLPLIGRRPVVYIVPSPPVLILKSQVTSFVVNGQGRAIMTTSQLSTISDQQLPSVTDQSGLIIKPGETAMPASYVSFITTVLGQLKAKKLAVDSMTLPARSFELDVHITGQPYLIKMNLQNDATEQIGTYLAAAQKLAQANQTPTSYFDVRVPGRVYYK